MARNPLDKEIAFYEAQKAEFERDHFMEWVVIRDQRVIGFFKSLQDAAAKYEEIFDGRHIMVRQVGFVPQPVFGVEFAST